jgi:hypothetical protein
MKKYRAEDYWFEITSGPSIDGHAIRYYVIHCRRCDRMASHKASGLSNDGLRKFFVRDGWTIGRSQYGHICPECLHKRERDIAKHNEDLVFQQAAAREALDLNEPPSRVAQMRTLWDQCNRREREEFVFWTESQIAPQINQELEEAIEQLVNRKPIIPSDVVDVAIDLVKTVATEDPAPPEDKEPADWWKELNSGTSK